MHINKIIILEDKIIYEKVSHKKTVTKRRTNTAPKTHHNA